MSESQEMYFEPRSSTDTSSVKQSLVIAGLVIAIIVIIAVVIWQYVEMNGSDGFDGALPEKSARMPTVYDFTTRLNTSHLNKNDARDLCRSYTQDVYSPPSECV